MCVCVYVCVYVYVSTKRAYHGDISNLSTFIRAVSGEYYTHATSTTTTAMSFVSIPDVLM